MIEELNEIPVVIKLSTGEELFAYLSGMNDKDVIVSKIFKINRILERGQDHNTVSRLIYEPWLDYGGRLNITLNRNHVILCEPLIPQLVPLYLEMIVNVTNIDSIPGEHIKPKESKPVLH